VKTIKYMTIVFLLIFGFSACTAKTQQTTAVPLEQEQPAAEVGLAATVPPAVAEPEQTASTGLEPLSADPQEFTFSTSDGVELKGVYYPAAMNPAPVVVLMHWVNSDQYDWLQIALWLQNRGVTSGLDEGYYGEWHDPGWFPSMPHERSYAVFTFTYRNCEGMGGCMQFNESGWLEDSRAAMQFAATLPGVDPTKMAAIGASIGADGAVDGCAWLNDQATSPVCQGALSLSPGDFLTLAYRAMVESMESDVPPAAAWCFYAVQDVPSRNDCTGASGTRYQSFEYSGNAHGMMMLVSDLDPLPMQRIIDFLYQIFGQ
jgi:hypothetical protein